ncbi:hypothetical protein AGMMS50293_02130 [Spirochaetia bacterium]|nr:hypothetical protein AGMMS50293_02130 [Spirochaetia bacterium]
MTVVIDVCGMAQILFQQEKTDKFSKLLAEADLILAPDLFVSELTNTLWKLHTAGKYNHEECLKFIEDGLDYIDTFVDSKKIRQEAFDEAVKHRHPAYDMFYLVTARRNGATLVTNDGDLAKICKKEKINICF